MARQRRKKLRYVRFYIEPWREIAKRCSRDALGVLFGAALEYADTGKEPDFSDCPSLESTWLMYRAQLDRDIERHGRYEDAPESGGGRPRNRSG